MWSYLGLFGYAVDSLIVNRVVPDGAGDPWLGRLRAAQAPHLDVIDAVPRPGADAAPIRPGEITGLEDLRGFGRDLYGDHDPLVWPAAPTAPASERPVPPNVLTLPLPGVTSDEVELARSGTVMLVTVGPFRRSLPLPRHLQDRRATGARVADGQLEVEFAP